jgi:hypothetical protein
VHSADRLTATAEGVEELDELRRRHPLAVVGNHAPVDAVVLDSLPLDTELDTRRLGFEGIHKRLANPLEESTLPVRPLDEVLCPCRLHRQDAGSLRCSHFWLPSPSSAWKSG